VVMSPKMDGMFAKKNTYKFCKINYYGLPVFYHGYQCFTTTLITLYKPNPFSDYLKIDDLRDYKYLNH
jgi:hypothetical protein